VPESLLYEYFDQIYVGFGYPTWPYSPPTDPADWTQSQDGLQLFCHPAGTGTGNLQTAARMFLTSGQRYFLEIIDIDAPHIDLLAMMQDTLLAGGPFVQWQILSGNLYGSAKSETGATAAGGPVAYNSTTMRYIGWLWDGTNMHAQYSSDATTWTDLVSIANMSNMHQQMILSVAASQTGPASPAFVTIPFINIPGTSNNATKMQAIALSAAYSAYLAGSALTQSSAAQGQWPRLFNDVEKSF